MAFIHEWFKVIKDEKLIGVTNNTSFARYSAKSGRIHICDALDGQYIIVNDKYYRDDWMNPTDPNSYAEYEPATVVSIDEKEYDILNSQMSGSVEPINTKFIIDSDPVVVHDIPKKNDTITIEFIRKAKIDELSAECEKHIENGFSLVLSDGASHHFSMSVKDQINLIALQQALNDGDDMIYHADGELEQFYSDEDTKLVLIGSQKWKNYNIALFNSLKNWINNIEDIEEINNIRYESEIPEKYCSSVLQMLSDTF